MIDNLKMFLCSREVYHTKRMQHVITVKWTSDNKYILCGSDEMNIRLWKANASEKLGVVSCILLLLSQGVWGFLLSLQTVSLFNFFIYEGKL